MPLVDKVCPICGTPFTCWQRPRREQQTCSGRCGAQLRRRKEAGFPRQSKARPRRIFVCEQCGREFKAGPYGKTRRFCGRSCSMTARWQDKETRAKLLRGGTVWPERRRAIFRAHMHRLNADPAVRERQAATIRGRTFPAQRGGNGQLTREQLALHQALGWPMEYPIPTGNRSWPAAVVDLANPELRIAIECDGASHRTRKQKNRDARKQTMLAALGWTLLRFWNGQITGNLPEVLATIHAAERARS